MARTSLLVDSSFLYALFNPKEPDHLACRQIIEQTRYRLLIPEVILPEVAFLFRRMSGDRAIAIFLEVLETSKPEFVSLDYQDIARALHIANDYADARFDFVDTCLMAMSERMNIKSICTLDKRDFRMFRPRHCDYLQLLPSDF